MIVDKSYLALRLDQVFAPCRDPASIQAIADIVARPCFAPLARVVLRSANGKALRRGRLSPAQVAEFMADPQCESVDLEARRADDSDDSAELATGRFTDRVSADLGDAGFWSEVSGFQLVAEPALHAARIEGFCDLAVQVRAIIGCISLEPNWSMGNTVHTGMSPPPLAESLTLPGYTEQRVRERTAYSDCHLPLDRELWGPEWGLFLSRGHLDRVPLADIQKSGAFARVQALSADLAYLQLTDDPYDTLRDDYDDLLDNARAVLGPILTDLSRVVIE